MEAREPRSSRCFREPDAEASTAVARALADVLDTNPAAAPPIFERVDPGSLDRLFDTDRSKASTDRVVFQVADCWVVVHADGTVFASARGERPAAPHRRLDVVYQVRYDWNASYSICLDLVETLDAVYERKGRRARPPLFETVDLDALDRVFQPTADSARDTGWVTFALEDYAVTVDASGMIILATDGGGRVRR